MAKGTSRKSTMVAKIPVKKAARTAARPRKAAPIASKDTEGGESASSLIDAKIKELGDWRGEMLARVRKLIHEADADIVETWKWMGTPVWEHDGIICTGETYKDYVKTTFARGASLADPAGLFNSSLEGAARRAIDFRKGVKIDDKAFKALIRAAVALNTSKRAKAEPAGSRKKSGKR